MLLPSGLMEILGSQTNEADLYLNEIRFSNDLLEDFSAYRTLEQ